MLRFSRQSVAWGILRLEKEWKENIQRPMPKFYLSEEPTLSERAMTASLTDTLAAEIGIRIGK